MSKAANLKTRIQNALDEIRPFLQSDGGDISLVSIEGSTVNVQLHGTCIGCSVNLMTLKNGVAMTIRKHAPEIQEVVELSTQSRLNA